VSGEVVYLREVNEGGEQLATRWGAEGWRDGFRGGGYRVTGEREEVAREVARRR